MKKRMTALVLAIALALSVSLSGCSALEAFKIVFGGETSESTEKPGVTDPTKKTDVPTKSETPADTSESGTEKPTETSEQPGTDAPDDPSEEQAEFLAFCDRTFVYFVGDNALDTHFLLLDPAALGIDDTTVTWVEPDESEEAKEEYETDLRNIYTELLSFKKDLLTDEQQYVYDCLQYMLDLELESLEFSYFREYLGANTGEQAYLPVYFAEYAFYDEQDVENYLELLFTLGAYFESLLQYEGEKAEAGLFMADDVLQEVIDQCETFAEGRENSFLIESFNERIDALDLSADDKRKYKAENEDAVACVYDAYEVLADGLKKMKGSARHEGGLANFPGGKDYYEWLVRYNTGSSKTPDEMAEALQEKIDEAINGLILLLYSKDMDKLLENMRYPWSDPAECMEKLVGFAKKEFPSLRDLEYNINYVDESLRDYLSPACYFLPPVDAEGHNDIYINCDRGDEPEDLFITLAHEGYPGHLLQNNYYKENSDIKLRRFLGATGYAEGWAEYVEIFSYEFMADSWDPDLIRYLQMFEELTLSIYCRCDIGVNWEGWDADDVLSYVSDYLNIDEENAEWIYKYVIGDPGGYLDYGIGYLEIQSLLLDAMDEPGFSYMDFHRKVLDLYGNSFELIRKYMFAD